MEFSFSTISSWAAGHLSVLMPRIQMTVERLISLMQSAFSTISSWEEGLPLLPDRLPVALIL